MNYRFTESTVVFIYCLIHPSTTHANMRLFHDYRQPEYQLKTNGRRTFKRFTLVPIAVLSTSISYFQKVSKWRPNSQRINWRPNCLTWV